MVKVGDSVRYSDVHDKDFRALVTSVDLLSDGPPHVGLVVVKEDGVVDLIVGVPHFSARIAQVEETRRDAKGKTSYTVTVPKRQVGDYWAE